MNICRKDPHSLWLHIFILLLLPITSASFSLGKGFTISRKSHCFLPSESASGSFLYVFGPQARRGLGARNSIFIAFLRVPTGLKDEIYISVFDPNASGANDPVFWGGSSFFQASLTKFTVYGGQGAFTDENARVARPSPEQKGTVLASKTFNREYDNKWFQFGPFHAEQGEIVGKWSYFKVVVHAMTGGNINAFRLAFSPRKATEVFAYILPLHLRMRPRQTIEFFVEIPRGMTEIIETNYDVDASGGTPYLLTSKRKTRLKSSGSGKFIKNPITLAPDDTGVRCIYRFVKGTQKFTNMAFMISDKQGRPLRIFNSDGPVEAAPPVASIQVPKVKIPEGADPCMSFVFDASKSFDPDQQKLLYEWDFGDGSPKSDKVRVVHVYEKPGTYTVKLVVNDGTKADCAVAQASQTVVANKRPIPDADTPVALITGEKGTFDASKSKDTPGEVLSYYWDFGDGTKAEGVKVTHAYDKGGEYPVKLTVKDDKDTKCSTATLERVVRVNTPPIANAGEDVFISKERPDEPFEVIFDGSKSTDPDGDKLSYSWDLGDGSKAEGPIVKHTYAKGGKYTVTLTVKDNSGLPGDTDSDEAVVVLNRAPQVVAAIPKIGCAGSDLTFDASKSADEDGDTLSYSWDFGDDSKGEGATVTHAYKEPGVYTVRLTVDDGKETNVSRQSVSGEIRIIGAPVAVIKPITPAPVGAPILCEADTTKNPEGRVLKYSWDFGDGNTATGPKIEHVYQKGDTYKIKLTVQDDSGLECGKAVAETNVRINTPPVVSLQIKDQICCINEPVHFDASASKDPDGDGLKYHWDFGDGETSEEVQPVHIYKKAGTFKITLTVTDTSGLPGASATASAIAKVNRPPVAKISVEQ